MDRGALRQSEDPRAVSEPGLSRQRGIRRRCRGAALLRQAGERSDAGRGGHARGPDQGALTVCADPRPRARPRPRRGGAEQHGGDRLDQGGGRGGGQGCARTGRRPAHPRRHRLLRGLGVRREPAVRRRGAAAPGGADHARSEAATRRGGGGGGGVRPGAHGAGSRAGGAGRDDPRRPGTRHARRSRLRRQPVQPRDPGGAPARLGVQAVRLSRRARGGAAPGGPHLGGADQGERLGATQPGRPLPDQHHPARLLRGIGQHRRGAPG